MMKTMNNIKKRIAKMICGVMVASTLFSTTAFAAEAETVEPQIEVEASVESETEETKVEAEATEAEATEAETTETETTETEAEESEAEESEVEESETEESEEAETTEVEETEAVPQFVELTIIVPGNTVIAKDGVVLDSFEAEVLLSEGVLTLSQPVADSYKNALQGDVTITIADATATVEFNGQIVNGTVSDELGNTVSFDGKTLEIVNSDNMEDTDAPEDEDDDKPEIPQEQPADYTVRYFMNSVADENLLHKDVVAGVVGQEIDLVAIELNAHKPADTEALVWADGVMQDGAATVIVEDDSDIIDIVYTSETVIIEASADFTVKYYRDALQEGNFLGEYKQGGNAGEGISYDSIDRNMFQPASYGNGEIQTVVSATVITEDDSDIVYVLYTRVEKEVQIVTETIEVPGETIVVEKEVIKEVPVEVEKIVTVEVPVEKIVEKIVEVPVEKIVEVPVEKVVTKTVLVPVETEKLVEVEKLVKVQKIVTVPGEKEVVYVEIPKTVIKEVEKVVEKEVPVYVEVSAEDNEEVISENSDPEYDEDEADVYYDGPQTGDAAPVALLVILMVMAVLGMAVVTKKNGAVAR